MIIIDANDYVGEVHNRMSGVGECLSTGTCPTRQASTMDAERSTAGEKREPAVYTRGGIAAAILAAGMIGLFVGLAWGAGKLPNLKEWQTLVAAGVALLAAAVAWANVQKQLRINLISREEDRIEKQLPALKNAASFVSLLHWQLETASELGPDRVEKHLAREGFTKGVNYVEHVEKLLPTTDYDLRDSVAGAIMRIDYQAMWRRIVNNEPDSIPEEAEKKRKEADARLAEALHELKDIADNLDKRIKASEKLLPTFRGEIERFFGQR